MTTEIHAVLLAAGTSKRMPVHNKLLLPWRGQPLICHMVQELVQSPIAKLTVVVNPDSDFNEIVKFHPKIIWVKNTNYESGMGSSLHAGLKTISGEAAGIMICLADMPMLTNTLYTTLIQAFIDLEIEQPKILIPTFEGSRGNPVIFSYELLQELIALPSDRDRGAKELIGKRSSLVTELPVNTNAILVDIDNWDDYRKIV